MIKLLDGVTANRDSQDDWVAFTAGNAVVKAVLAFAGLDGATGTVLVRYDDVTTEFTVHSTTSDELKLAELVGNLGKNASPSSAFTNGFELRATISDVQAGTDATIGIT